MWDILDLTSSTLSDPLNTSDLVPQSDGATARETQVQHHGQRHGTQTSTFAAQNSPMVAGPSQPMEDSTAPWSFDNRVGNMPLAVVPDIPDWMIFGDFTEHL